MKLFTTYLNLKEPKSKNFKAKFILGFEGKKGNKESVEKQLNVASQWVHVDFIRSEIFDPEGGYLIDGKLTLYCKVSETIGTIGHFRSKIDQQRYLSAHSHCTGSQ